MAAAAYLKQRNMTGVELYQEFEYRMFAMLKKLGKDTVTWDSTFNTGMKLPPNAVVHDYQGGAHDHDRWKLGCDHHHRHVGYRQAGVIISVEREGLPGKVSCQVVSL